MSLFGRQKEPPPERTYVVDIFPDLTNDERRDLEPGVPMRISKHGWNFIVYRSDAAQIFATPEGYTDREAAIAGAKEAIIADRAGLLPNTFCDIRDAKQQ